MHDNSLLKTAYVHDHPKSPVETRIYLLSGTQVQRGLGRSVTYFIIIPAKLRRSADKRVEVARSGERAKGGRTRTRTRGTGHARYAWRINVEDVRRPCRRSYASRRLCRTISEERQLPFTHPRSHFPPSPRMERVPLRLLRIVPLPRSSRPRHVSIRIHTHTHIYTRSCRSIVNVYAYVPAFPARGYRSTVQYRFFRNAGHTQGEPAEKRLTVNRDALPSDNIIQFREPVAVTFRGNRS